MPEQTVSQLCQQYGLEEEQVHDALSKASHGADAADVASWWTWVKCACGRKLARRSDKGVLRVRKFRGDRLGFGVDTNSSARIYCAKCRRWSTFHATPFDSVQHTKPELMLKDQRFTEQFQETRVPVEVQPKAG